MNNAVNCSLFRSFFLFCFVSFISVLTHAISPELLEQLKKNHVVDTTQTLSLEEIEQLKIQNEQLYKKKNIDFKILMVPSIGETPIEEYALNVFNSIKIGDKKLDNGLLLVISKNDRKMRFEVGYGLEGDITDVQAGRLIRNVLAPNFKNANYFTGIKDVQLSILGDHNPIEAKPHKNNDRDQIKFNVNFYIQLVLSIMLTIPLYWVYLKTTIRLGSSAAIGAYMAILVFEIFAHILFFPENGFFLSALIPLYAPLLIWLLMPKDQTYKFIKIILYSLLPIIFSFLSFFLFYYFNIFSPVSEIILKILSITLILIFLRYLQFLYRLKNKTEYAYLTNFYNDYLRTKERSEAKYRESKKQNFSDKSKDNNSSNSSSSSSDSSSSSSDNSSSNDRDSGGSSGGGGASGGW
jgi:uncharacterized protein